MRAFISANQTVNPAAATAAAAAAAAAVPKRSSYSARSAAATCAAGERPALRTAGRSLLTRCI